MSAPARKSPTSRSPLPAAGRLFGAVITGLLSGPENGYTLSVNAPAA